MIIGLEKNLTTLCVISAVVSISLCTVSSALLSSVHVSINMQNTGEKSLVEPHRHDLLTSLQARALKSKDMEE